jgi:YVTN family beta-propeller protein
LGDQRGLLRALALIAGWALLGACANYTTSSLPPSPSLTIPPAALATPAPTAAPTAVPTPTPEPRLYSKLRVFVTAEGNYYSGTGELWVLESDGRSEFEVTRKIPMGGWPHNMAVSPDGKWIAVANRSSHQLSIVDPIELKEVARIAVGKQPHGILWHPDGGSLFVGAERDGYISRIETGTWKLLPRIDVGAPQHVFLMRPDRPDELWYTVTFFGQWQFQDDHLRVYDLKSGRITRVKVADVHDAYFTPDGSEIWSSSSGFLDKPSDRMVIYDPIERVVKQEIRLPGRYPFHTMKRSQDGMYFPKDTSVMLLSSHYSAEKGRNGAALLWVDWKARKVIDETPLGVQPFHIAYDPVGSRVLVTSNVDGMVNVIDWKTRKVTQKLPVPKPHGIAAVGIP